MEARYNETCERVGRPLTRKCRRKVRAGKGTVVANGHTGRPDGKCNRKYTAEGASLAMVKRCGKSAPRPE